MTPRQRLWFFAVAAAGLVACYLWAFTGLPGFGSYPGPTARRSSGWPPQTNATGVVSAINFEYRGFDTVGEEFILFAAAAGMSVVLRKLREERERPSRPTRPIQDRPAEQQRRPGSRAADGRPHGPPRLVAGLARADQPVRRLPGRRDPGDRVHPHLPGR